MGKSSISMAIFNSYVSLPGATLQVNVPTWFVSFSRLPYWVIVIQKKHGVVWLIIHQASLTNWMPNIPQYCGWLRNPTPVDCWFIRPISHCRVSTILLVVQDFSTIWLYVSWFTPVFGGEFSLIINHHIGHGGALSNCWIWLCTSPSSFEAAKRLGRGRKWEI